MTATVTHLCRVHGLLPDSGAVGTTAIDKRPVDGPVKVRKLGLYADLQADRVHHGGLDQALYAYSQQDADHFAQVLGHAVEPGLFGENLRVSDMDVSAALIGERWQIGDGVTVEVTSPREPCATFARRLGQDRWVRRFTEEGRPGAYLRVLTVGQISAGDAITVLSRPQHTVTVGGWLADRTPDKARALLEAQRDGVLSLGEDILGKVVKLAR